jgi:hypothetical protein
MSRNGAPACSPPLKDGSPWRTNLDDWSRLARLTPSPPMRKNHRTAVGEPGQQKAEFSGRAGVSAGPSLRGSYPKYFWAVPGLSRTIAWPPHAEKTKSPGATRGRADQRRGRYTTRGRPRSARGGSYPTRHGHRGGIPPTRNLQPALYQIGNEVP